MQRLMLAVCVIAIVFVSGTSRLLTAGQASPPVRERIDVSKLGPRSGERVPDFSLTDQNGACPNTPIADG